jgi:antitoxin component YwqK of YwqJK toxin-antitoxin module
MKTKFNLRIYFFYFFLHFLNGNLICQAQELSYSLNHNNTILVKDFDSIVKNSLSKDLMIQTQKDFLIFYNNKNQRVSDNSVIIKYNSDTVAIQGTIQNGFMNNKWTAYYSSGQIKMERFYKNGIVDGLQKEYYKNGKLHGEIPFINGEKNGVVKLYNRLGDLNFKVHAKPPTQKQKEAYAKILVDTTKGEKLSREIRYRVAYRDYEKVILENKLIGDRTIEMNFYTDEDKNHIIVFGCYSSLVRRNFQFDKGKEIIFRFTDGDFFTLQFPEDPLEINLFDIITPGHFNSLTLSRQLSEKMSEKYLSSIEFKNPFNKENENNSDNPEIYKISITKHMEKQISDELLTFYFEL